MAETANAAHAGKLHSGFIIRRTLKLKITTVARAFAQCRATGATGVLTRFRDLACHSTWGSQSWLPILAAAAFRGGFCTRLPKRVLLLQSGDFAHQQKGRLKVGCSQDWLPHGAIASNPENA